MLVLMQYQKNIFIIRGLFEIPLDIALKFFGPRERCAKKSGAVGTKKRRGGHQKAARGSLPKKCWHACTHRFEN